MDLSEADAKKWSPLIAQVARALNGLAEPESGTATKYRCARKVRQRQKRLSEGEISQLIEAYHSGLTVYQLADEFGCHRTTVSECLKARGIRMRLTPLTENQIDQAVALYQSGLSLIAVGEAIGANAETIRQRLIVRGVARRERP